MLCMLGASSTQYHLTESLKHLHPSILPFKENRVVEGIERPTHPHQNDFQAACEMRETVTGVQTLWNQRWRSQTARTPAMAGGRPRVGIRVSVLGLMLVRLRVWG